MSDQRSSLVAPVRNPDVDEELDGREDGIALCLSGGGFRAALFHTGALWRIHQVDLLRRCRRISSVSGGSITSGVLADRWRQLVPRDGNSFREQIVAPLRALADHTIDAGAVISGLLLPGSIANKVDAAYRRHLFDDRTLQDLPEESEGAPRFVFNATNVQSGALWRFSKPYMGDYRVGLIAHPQTPIATAIAASSAFPPALSPLSLDLRAERFQTTAGADLSIRPFTSEAVLSDGGVYDNLGLETAYKRYTTLLVSDGGQKMRPDPEPAHDWARHSMRVLSIIDDQVRNLRKRQLIEAFQRGDQYGRTGAYWGIRSHVADYGVSDPLGAAQAPTENLANIPTRLARLESDVQEKLINWGYSICDVALRAHFDEKLQDRWSIDLNPEAELPYPRTGM